MPGEKFLHGNQSLGVIKIGQKARFGKPTNESDPNVNKGSAHANKGNTNKNKGNKHGKLAGGRATKEGKPKMTPGTTNLSHARTNFREELVPSTPSMPSGCTEQLGLGANGTQDVAASPQCQQQDGGAPSNLIPGISPFPPRPKSPPRSANLIPGLAPFPPRPRQNVMSMHTRQPNSQVKPPGRSRESGSPAISPAPLHGNNNYITDRFSLSAQLQALSTSRSQVHGPVGHAPPASPGTVENSYANCIPTAQAPSSQGYASSNGNALGTSSQGPYGGPFK